MDLLRHGRVLSKEYDALTDTWKITFDVTGETIGDQIQNAVKNIEEQSMNPYDVRTSHTVSSKIAAHETRLEELRKEKKRIKKVAKRKVREERERERIRGLGYEALEKAAKHGDVSAAKELIALADGRA